MQVRKADVTVLLPETLELVKIFSLEYPEHQSESHFLDRNVSVRRCFPLWLLRLFNMDPESELPPATYLYQPLSSQTWIRIVHLLPAEKFDDPLMCNIVHIDRDTNIQSTDVQFNSFEAVSYVWGEPSFTHRLVCDDGKTIAITDRVDRMLRYFRKRTKSRNLW